MNDFLDETDFDSKPVPVKSLLAGSVYYPAAGRDGDPVRFLGQRFQSFVYVDYGIRRDDVLQSLNDPHQGFRGYQVTCVRDLKPEDLVPHGWQPSITPDEVQRAKAPPTWWIKQPFAIWALLDRRDEFGDEHGPGRFSLLYIGGDGVATYQALYHGNKVAPAVVCIIQPGTGFGGNWTNFCDPEGILARSVMKNPAGSPGHLLYDGWGSREDYRQPCWPKYGQLTEEYARGIEGGLCLFQ
ncbi:MAG: hypothetical protein GC164_16070 [Phycisphaera sp.]|nr:hypothetical protein [Phycisphaera sp.]